MPELEIHAESEHAIDPVGQRVGILAAALAVFLAVVTILSHRAHTEGIMHKSTANDQWAYYQATRVKYHGVEMGEKLVSVLGAKGESEAKALADYAAQEKKYDKEGQEIQNQAREADEAAEHAEKKALRFDIGEGMLEIALVVTSLYFISRKTMFPVMGVVAGVAGVVTAITGLLV